MVYTKRFLFQISQALHEKACFGVFCLIHQTLFNFITKESPAKVFSWHLLCGTPTHGCFCMKVNDRLSLMWKLSNTKAGFKKCPFTEIVYDKWKSLLTIVNHRSVFFRLPSSVKEKKKVKANFFCNNFILS